MVYKFSVIWLAGIIFWKKIFVLNFLETMFKRQKQKVLQIFFKNCPSVFIKNFFLESVVKLFQKLFQKLFFLKKCSNDNTQYCQCEALYNTEHSKPLRPKKSISKVSVKVLKWSVLKLSFIFLMTFPLVTITAVL